MQLVDFTEHTNQRRQNSRSRAAHIAWWPAALLMLAFFAASANAQYRTSIQGTVSDSTGAYIPGATLTLKNLATNETVVRTSNDEGIFNFNALPAAHFTLTVAREGFQTKTLDDLQLIPEQPNALNVQLQVGGTTQTVTVDASTAPAMDTQTATISTTINSNDVVHMPSFQRDVFQLSQLAPGAVSDGSQTGGGGTFNLPGNQGQGGTAGSGRNEGIFQTENGPQINANGSQYETNNISIDGISTVSAVWGGATVITPSEESVDNVKISTNDYDAENGRFSGAITQVTSKSGTNAYHGSLFFQINRPGLNAYQRYNGPGSTNPCDPTNPEPCAQQKGLLRNSQRFNQFGGSVGGPFWKNKIFGFFSYETIRNNSNNTGTGWYDTTAFDALAPSGSIANTFLTFPGGGVVSSGIIAETCQDIGLVEGVTCNTIGNSGLNIGSPLAAPLGTQDSTWASPTVPGAGDGLSTTVADIADYATVNPDSTVEAQYNGRLDADVTSKDHASFAIYWQPETETTYNGGDRAYNLFHHDQINDAFSVIWNHTFSPNFLNEARANAAGWRWNEIISNPQSPVGLPAAGINAIGSPSIGLNQFGSALGSILNQWTYGYKDVATKVFGRHTLKFGGDFTRVYYLNDPIGRPGYNFFNVWDFLNDAPKEEYGSFDTVTGLPGGVRADDREYFLGFFVQDSWKVRPGLTLNAGLRYGYFGPLYDKQNNLSVVQFGTGADYLTGISMRQGGDLWKSQKGNFGPQIGFNWSPDFYRQKMVVRGGFGLNFNQNEIAITSGGNNNPPTQSYYDFNSGSPTTINANIQYGVSSSPNSLFGFAPNPNTVTTYNANFLPVGGSANVTAFPANLPTEYTYHYSLATEYEFGYHMVFSLGYQGSVSHHLITQYNANAVAAMNGLALNPLITSVGVYANTASSNNNMMLAELKHQFSHSFSADAQFTWGRSMDDGSGPYTQDSYYPVNPSLVYGRSDFDVNRIFKLYGLWQPVLFHSSHNWAEKVAGGWSLSGILNLHTGFGWTPTYSTGVPLYYNAAYEYTSLRPYYLGGAGSSTSNNTFKSGPNGNFPDIDTNVTQTATSYSNKYFSMPDFSAAVGGGTFPGAAAGPPPPPGLSRNSFKGPGYRDVDLTLTKSFGLPNARILGEDGKIEIRADIFNLFNLLNFNPTQISNNITATNFGEATAALGARTVDFQARFSF